MNQFMHMLLSFSGRRGRGRFCPDVTCGLSLGLSESQSDPGTAGPREQSHSTVPGGA